MACDIPYDNVIFSVHKMSRYNNAINYVFIGIIEPKILEILKKFEDRKKITGDEIKILKEKYSNDDINNWINIVKNKIKIKFIQEKIQIDDTISDIRKKIFIYLSDIENKKYILQENQELWLEKKTGNYEIIGYFYENIKTKEKLKIKPQIYEDPIDKTNFKNYSFNTKDLKKNTSENNMLIYDLLVNFKNTIYLSDAKEEEEYLKSKNISITEKLIDNYFKKYWPYVNLSYKVEEVRTDYVIMKEYYNKESYIFNLINTIPIDKNYFGSCNILTIILNINDEKNSQEIDLYQIFDYIKDNKISDKIPFIKYSEDSLETTYSIISKEAIKNKKLDKNLLKSWLFGIKDSIKKINGITIKKYLKEYNNESRYSNIFINKSGNISLSISFKSENNASFNDVEYAVKDCKKLITDINKVLNRINEDINIDTPNMDIKNNEILLKKNTKIMFMNVIIPIYFKENIDFKLLLDFSKKFPYFFSEVDNKDKEENSIVLKYKRVSLFANMNDILYEIDKLKVIYPDDEDIRIIINILQKKYDKSIDEIKRYLLEWEKKYHSKQSSIISSDFKKGILIKISKNNILIKGITKIYQISLIYNFMVCFLTLFINYDEYIKKDKDFKKIITSKNLNKDIKFYDEKYEINKNTKLNLNINENINYNLEYDDYNNVRILDEIEDIPDEIQYEDINIKPEMNIIGLARDDELDPNVRLKCDDILPDKDTCTDFCNDERYFLRRLQRYDPNLFIPKKDKKDKKKYTYARTCQSELQPVVMPYDPSTSTNPKINRESYTFALKYSSNPDLFDRWYICPKIWCPYCEVPISESDIDPKTIREKRFSSNQEGLCKTAICPFGNHQVIFKKSSTDIYPGFKDSSFHPNGLCSPCCFKKNHSNIKSGHYKEFKKCLGDEVENNNVKDGQIYILSKGIPIQKDRYGKLPIDISRILKTNLDKGYLENKSGYLRKGINHEKNNSFLSAITDVISCDKKNVKSIDQIKHILIEKLNNNLFKTLYSGNLINLFHNVDNFKNYLLSNSIDINHLYLWDYLQRPNILFDNGINIFIFENNKLLCPIGENIKYFFDSNKKSILLIKSKEFYEPIYFLEGSTKSAKITCIFDYDNEEIKKIFDISFNGCAPKFDIDWTEVLKHNIIKYNLKIDNLSISDGDDLQTTLNELLINIQNKKLDKEYFPNLQYIDSYNKVFGLKLRNGLYLPVAPSKLIEHKDIKYETILDINDIEKISVNFTMKYSNLINKITNLKCEITHKVLNSNKHIIALVNENNRFIPVKDTLNIKNDLKISNLTYYPDIDKALYEKNKIKDERIDLMNKKHYEDETFIRMKFELSKFLTNSANIKILNDILAIINLDNINLQREKIYKVLNSIFSELITEKNKNIDFYDYTTPNKRVPCYLRKTNDINLSCESDPHCVMEKNKCKLYINKINLLNKNIHNYNYYISKIVDELLRYKMKRDEILEDKIPNIINRDIIEKNTNKYIVIDTLNTDRITNILDELFLDNKGIFIDNRNLYENSDTKEIGFVKELYTKSNILLTNKTEDLSIYWLKYLKHNFKVLLTDNNTIFSILINVLNLDQFKSNKNKYIDIFFLKNSIIDYLTKLNENNTIKLYKLYNKKFKTVSSYDNLFNEILNESYNGSIPDLDIISKLYSINIIILNKRITKDDVGYKVYKTGNNYKSNYFIILYKSINYDIEKYNIIEKKNNYIFKINDFPPLFIKNIIEVDNK